MVEETTEDPKPFAAKDDYSLLDSSEETTDKPCAAKDDHSLLDSSDDHKPNRCLYYMLILFLPVLFIILELLGFYVTIRNTDVPKILIEYVSFVSSENNTANWDINFSIHPVKSGRALYLYDGIEASIFHQKEFISKTVVEPIYVGDSSYKTADARFSVLLNDIAEEAWSGGVISFDMNIKLQEVDWFLDSSDTMLFKAKCSDLYVIFPSRFEERRLIDGPIECKTQVADWSQVFAPKGW